MSDDDQTPTGDQQSSGEPGEESSSSLLSGDPGDQTPPAAESEQSDTEGNAGEPEGDKSSEQKVEDGAPEAYADFSAPEGLELDAALVEEASPLFKEMNLSQENAQKLVDLYAKQIQASQDSQLESFENLRNEWAESSKNDPEFGGDKFEENVKQANSLINKFGTPELKKFLDESGAGNHPEMIRIFHKLQVQFSQDVPEGGTRSTQPTQDRVSILYPTGSD